MFLKLVARSSMGYVEMAGEHRLLRLGTYTTKFRRDHYNQVQHLNMWSRNGKISSYDYYNFKCTMH